MESSSSLKQLVMLELNMADPVMILYKTAALEPLIIITPTINEGVVVTRTKTSITHNKKRHLEY